MTFQELKDYVAMNAHYDEMMGDTPQSFVGYLVDMAFNRLGCWLMGHEVVDGDPGNPEVGPDPDIYCTVCHTSDV